MSYKIKAIIFLIFITLIFTQIHPPACAQDKPLAERWAPFQFLIGNWTGIGSGKPGESAGFSSFLFELNQNILIRKNKVDFPAKPGEKSGPTHEDLMIIYQQTGDTLIHAIYFDNEGHVINYLAIFPAKQPSVIFESEGGEKSMRFRLIYELLADGQLSIEFAMAPSGGDFKTYTKGLAKHSE